MSATDLSVTAPKQDVGRARSPLAAQAFPVGLILIGLLSLAMGPGALALVCAILLLSPVMPGPTVLQRTATAIPAFMALVASVLTVLALLDLTVDWRALAACLVVVTGLVSLLVSPSDSTPRRWLSPDDIWATVTAAISLLLLARSFVGASTGRRMALLSHGTDAGTHLQLAKAILEHGGYVTFLDGTSPHLVEGVQQYPPGLSGALALVLGVGPGPTATPAQILQIAPYALTFLYALLVWFAVRLTLTLAREVSGQGSHPSAALGAALLCPVLLLGFNVFLAQGGAYTQAVATTCCLAMLIVAAGEKAPGLRTTLVIAALAILACQTWYLLAAVLVAPIVAHASRLTGGAILRRSWIAVVGLPISLFPLLTGPDAHSQLDSTGAAPTPTLPGVLGLLLGLAVGVTYLSLQRPPRNNRAVKAAVASTVCALVLAVGVIGLQMHDGGTIKYYGVKALYLLFLLGCILSTSAAIAAVTRPRRSARRLAAPAMVAAALLGPVTAMVATWPVVDRFVSGLPPRHQDGAVLDAIFVEHPFGSDPSGPDIWVADGCNRPDDQIASKWAYDMGGGWSADRESTWLSFAYSSPDDLDALATRARQIAPRLLQVYVHENCQPEALRALTQAGNVEVIRVP
jgi:hypothetical protein